MIAALAVGCNAGRRASEPVLTTRSDVYEPGDQVAVALKNETEASVGYNICFAFLGLERQDEGRWEPVQVGLGPEPDAACTLQLNSLLPGESAESTAYLPEDLASGTYRISTDVELGDAREVVRTGPFEIRAETVR